LVVSTASWFRGPFTWPAHFGWCGSSIDHCAPGNCRSGDCDQTLGGPSTDGSCGPNFPGDKICAGTQFGKCCSN